MKKLVAVLLTSLFFLVGCAGTLSTKVADHPMLAQTSVQAATVYYLDYMPERIGPMAENVNKLKLLVNNGAVGSLDEMAELIKFDLLADEEMTPPKRLIVNNLIDSVIFEGRRILEIKGYTGEHIVLTDPVAREVALKILDWMLDGHRIMEISQN